MAETEQVKNSLIDSWFDVSDIIMGNGKVRRTAKFSDKFCSEHPDVFDLYGKFEDRKGNAEVLRPLMENDEEIRANVRQKDIEAGEFSSQIQGLIGVSGFEIYERMSQLTHGTS